MISLKTLDDASAQDVFNHIVNHLLVQKEKSVNSGGDCMYRGLNGLKCAAGCIIADDEYGPEMEYKTWYNLMDEGTFYIGNDEFVLTTEHSDLIHDLQTVHDRHEPDEWEELLRSVGNSHGLEWQYDDEEKK